ncbi:MAG: hypothetical protein D6799_03170 [Bacteroidetes bacterium]|jgi:regulator of sirC expression with transglutaminase-like and TPR domain|nr:MAG: hypothetical protein D6799_03170 [Bacteroidota bacterium]
MNSPRDQLSNTQIEALIKLLDDPDESVFTEVKNQLLLLGPVALPYLEKVWNDAMNSWITQRVEEIIEDIKFNELANDLIKWKYHQQEDLFYAVWLINRFQYPEVTPESLNKKIEQIKKDIWIEFAEDLTALEEVMIINHILYEVHQFSPNIANYNAVQNNYLHYVLENKKGNNISLGILYLLLAQKLDIPIFAINIPGYLILSYINDAINLYDANFQSLQDATLFYINPFSKGILLQKEDILQFLEQTHIPYNKDCFIPCSNADIIEKLLLSIAHSYAQQSNTTLYSKYKNVAEKLKRE